MVAVKSSCVVMISAVKLSCIVIIYVQTVLYSYPNPLVYWWLRSSRLVHRYYYLILLCMDSLRRVTYANFTDLSWERSPVSAARWYWCRLHLSHNILNRVCIPCSLTPDNGQLINLSAASVDFAFGRSPIFRHVSSLYLKSSNRLVFILIKNVHPFPDGLNYWELFSIKKS